LPKTLVNFVSFVVRFYLSFNQLRQMKISILTYGSRGDVQPMASLALGLQRAGHKVQLAAPHRFADFAGGYGIPFTPLPGDPEAMSALLNDAGGNVVKAVQGMTKYIFSIAEPVARAAFAACRDVDLIAHSFLFTTGAHSVARARGIPDVSVQGFPMFAPTQAFPNVVLPNLAPGAPSYISHWLAAQIFWHVGNWGFRHVQKNAPDVFAPHGGKNFRLHWPFAADGSKRSAQAKSKFPHGDRHFDGAQARSNESKRDPRGDGHLDDSRQPPTPLLFAYSPTVLPRPADWSDPNIHITGYFFLDAPEAYRPPAELERFLAAGGPPVCVTFGSMINQDAERIDGIVRSALAQTGQRGVVLTGWGGASRRNPRSQGLPDGNLLYLDAAPHDTLFPRCKAVVHHGGAGTTAAGLRAGIPNIVIPHAVDQLFWGKRVAAIGAGPRPIELKQLSVESLCEGFQQAESSELQAAARRIGERIRAEDGIGRAVEIIEGHAAAFHGYV
jgi:UDP:flavonoid glycosyltransferase YjiC (YdhE family)